MTVNTKMSTPFALIIEDNADIAFIAGEALKESGYQAEIIGTGQEAQARLAFETPDLILLDLHLPFLDGEVILRQIKNNARLLKTKVIVSTGDPRAAQALQDEADFVFIKPISYEQLRDLAARLNPHLTEQ